MLTVLRHPLYARLFAAQVIALLGTGLLTVALGLLAYDLAGGAAGAVLGTAYVIKMVAYVGLSPVAAAVFSGMDRRRVMIAADLLRAGVALCLPFVDAIWQVYVLILLLQSASATFTPTFQAAIPDVLPDEAEYTRALSLSRLAYDMENLLSPLLAGLLLTVISYHWLFGGTVVGFAVSGALLLSLRLPAQAVVKQRAFAERLQRGARIYLATPRLRGLLALNLTAAAAGAFVLVNTVVLVRGEMLLGDGEVALALAAFGAGSMIAALGLPRLLDKGGDRWIMQTSAIALSGVSIVVAMLLLGGFGLGLTGLAALWAVIGLLYSAILTPSGRLLRRSAHSEDRPAVFTAQFQLSHLCWLVTYPVAGWVGEAWGLGAAMAALAVLATIGAVVARLVWPGDTGGALEHDHPDLPTDHPHLAGDRKGHAHVILIDDEHRVWPTHG